MMTPKFFTTEMFKVKYSKNYVTSQGAKVSVKYTTALSKHVPNKIVMT